MTPMSLYGPDDVRIAAMRCVEEWERPGWKKAEADLVAKWRRWRGDDLEDGEVIVYRDWVLTIMWHDQNELVIFVQETVAVFYPGPRHKKSTRDLSRRARAAEAENNVG